MRFTGKQAVDGSALKGNVADFIADKGVKVITVHDFTMALISQTPTSCETDRLMLVAAKDSVHDLSKNTLGAEIICAALARSAI